MNGSHMVCWVACVLGMYIKIVISLANAASQPHPDVPMYEWCERGTDTQLRCGRAAHMVALHEGDRRMPSVRCGTALLAVS
jgi:hypothetical protein